MTILEATVLLFLVMDPLGNVPLFLVLMKDIDKKRHIRILTRELIIALGIMIVLLFFGKSILNFFTISLSSIKISGGIILFLIAIKMIFSGGESIFTNKPEGEPFIVPLAVPLIAGPSVMATIIILSAANPSSWPNWLIAIILAWIPTALILIFSERLSHKINTKFISAMENLMGMLLTALAVEMFINGVKMAFEK